MFRLFTLPIFHEADAGAGSGAGNTDADAGNAADNGNTAGTEKTFTQADLDRVLSDRLARERKKLRSEVEAELKAEADKAAMTEAERLKAEKDAAEQKATQAQETANARIIRAEAKAKAIELGIKADRVDYALKLADLSAVTLNDSGDPNPEAITAALSAVLSVMPELKGVTAERRGGGDFGGGTPPPVDLENASMEEFAKARGYDFVKG